MWATASLSSPAGYWMFAVEWPFPVMLAILATLSILGGAVNPLLVTVRMERIPPELRGRVFSTTSAIAMGMQPVGIVSGGALVEWAGLRTAVLVLAGLSSVVGVVIFLLPIWRRPDDTRPERQPASANG